MLVNYAVLRLAWAIVEETLPDELLKLSDPMLVRFLALHVAQKILLSHEELRALCHYLASKTPLIRDIAESRLIENTCSMELNLMEQKSIGQPFSVHDRLLSPESISTPISTPISTWGAMA